MHIILEDSAKLALENSLKFKKEVPDNHAGFFWCEEGYYLLFIGSEFWELNSEKECWDKIRKNSYGKF